MAENFTRNTQHVLSIAGHPKIELNQNDMLSDEKNINILNQGKFEQITGAVIDSTTTVTDESITITESGAKDGTEYVKNSTTIKKGVTSAEITDGNKLHLYREDKDGKPQDITGSPLTLPSGGDGALTPFHFVAHTKGGDAMDILDFTGYGIVIESGDATKTLTIYPSILSVEAMATADYTIDPSSPLGLTFKSIGNYDLSTINDIDMFATATHIDLNVETNKFVPMYFNLQYMNNAGMINDNLYITPDSAITITAGKQGQTIIRK